MRSWLLLVAVINNCMAAMLLQSPDFDNFQSIPLDYGCNPYYPKLLVGMSPPLMWHRIPDKTQSLLLVVDDINSEGNIHWLVSNIPPNTTAIEKDASRYTMPIGSIEYYNSFGDIGYALMCPINATHVYRFRLYALRISSFQFQSYDRYRTEYPITLADVEQQLVPIADDIIYVSTLVGHMMIQGPNPDAPRPSPSPGYPAVPFDPIEELRYVKPSETLPHSRPHYNPRPVQFPNTDDICKRFREGQYAKNFAQICNSTGNTTVIEKGGPEQPDPSVHHAKFRQNLMALTPTQSSKDTATPKADIGGVVSEPPKEVSAFSGFQKNENDFLVEWECESKELPNERGNPLRLRSAAIDTCASRENEVPLMPSEFTCERAHPGASRTSPPLTWRLEKRLVAAGSACVVSSYVLMLEDVKSGRMNWIIKDIPPTVDHLELGVSGESGNEFGVEQLNSYGTDRYSAPCPEAGTPRLFRFHLFARPSRLTMLIGTDSGPSTGFKQQMADSCHVAYLDFVVA